MDSLTAKEVVWCHVLCAVYVVGECVCVYMHLCVANKYLACNFDCCN